MKSLHKTILQALAVGAVFSFPFIFAAGQAGNVDDTPAESIAKQHRTTHSQLEQQKRQIKQGIPGASKEESPSRQHRPNIYQKSIILSDGKTHTLLPSSSIVWVPEALKSKVVQQPIGSYVPWPKFYVAHRNWLMAYSVSLKQAQGKAAIPLQARLEFKKLNRIVVTHLHNFPVSVSSPSSNPSIK